MTNSISRRALIQRVIAGAGLGFASLSSSNIAIAQEMILASNSQSDFFPRGNLKHSNLFAIVCYLQRIHPELLMWACQISLLCYVKITCKNMN